MGTSTARNPIRELPSYYQKGESEGPKVVKVRWVKPYEEAQNHVCIGQVLEETPTCLKVLGRTYHFRRPPGGGKSVTYSAAKVRWIPWSRVEVVTELPPDTDWQNLRLKVDEQNRLCVVGDPTHGELIGD